MPNGHLGFIPQSIATEFGVAKESTIVALFAAIGGIG
jgi:hypothetical protein